jgi:hypothetical protein
MLEESGTASLFTKFLQAGIITTVAPSPFTTNLLLFNRCSTYLRQNRSSIKTLTTLV